MQLVNLIDILFELGVEKLDSLKIVYDNSLNNISTTLRCIESESLEIMGNDFWGSFIGVLAGGLISFGIYKLGEYYDKKKIKTELEDLGSSICVLLDSSFDNVKGQISEYNKYISSIKSDPTKPYQMKINSSYNLRRLKSFDPSLIYKIFKHYRQSKDVYNRFLKSIDLIDELIKNIEMDYDENNSNYVVKLSNDFLQITQEILTDTANHINELQSAKENNTEKYKFLNQLVIDYYQNLNTDMPEIKYDYEKFISPLKFEMVKNYRFDNFSKVVTSKTKRASDLYFTVVQSNKTFSETIESQLNNIEMCNINLNNIKVELEKKLRQPTRSKANKGLSGVREFMARINFRAT